MVKETREREIRTKQGRLLFKVIVRGKERYVSIKEHGCKTIYRIPLTALTDDEEAELSVEIASE